MLIIPKDSAIDAAVNRKIALLLCSVDAADEELAFLGQNVGRSLTNAFMSITPGWMPSL